MSTNKERIGLLTAALRSGEYEQGKGSLRTRKNKFCCLGVACDIYSKTTGIGKWNFDGKSWIFEVPHAEVSGVLPQEVADWYGLKDINPDVTIGNFNRPVANFNDGWDNERTHQPEPSVPFSEIANAFEALP